MRQALAPFLLVWLLSACSTTAPPSEPWTDNFNQVRDSAIAMEVRSFIVQRQGCDHFRGEPGYDEERQKFLNQQMKKLCKGTDVELIRLRRKYADQPSTLKALVDFEDCIEYDSLCSTRKQER